MKKTTFLFSVLLLVSGSIVHSQTLDDVLKKHFEAMGQDKLAKVNSQKVSGKMIQNNIEIPFTQFAKRPSFVRVEATFQALTLIQTYNGKEGWNLNPFNGATEAQPFSEDELKSMRYQADMDGMLWNPAEKGYTLTLEGKDDMEGTSCFVIRVDTKDGDTFKYYIDSDSYILLRTNSKVKVQGNIMENDSYYTNYMQVDGIAVPGKTETKVNGQLAQTMVIDKVEFNVQLDNSIFDKPQKQPSATNH